MKDERFEQFLKDAVMPEYRSDQHRTSLRSEIISQVGLRRSRALPGRKWRTVALLAGLLCAGPAATELVLHLHHYYFEGRSKDGSYYFSTGPETVHDDAEPDYNGSSRSTVVTRISAVSVGADDQVSDTIDIEQTRRDLEEIDVLREMDQRTLLSVTETEVNGSAAARAYLYKYVLSDGRIKTVGEGGFDRSRPSPDQVTRDQQAMDALRVQGNYDVRKIIDVEVQGHVQRTLICRYTLSGGREQTRGESDPSLSAPGVVLDSEQDRELMRLVSLKNGELLSASKAQMFGKTFIFQRFLYTLPDRTVVMYSEGQPYPKAELADADWNELNDLRKSGAGVTLGTFQQEFRGQLLNFTRVKYVLSDGTEVIQSRGEAVQEQ